MLTLEFSELELFAVTSPGLSDVKTALQIPNRLVPFKFMDKQEVVGVFYNFHWVGNSMIVNLAFYEDWVFALGFDRATIPKHAKKVDFTARFTMKVDFELTSTRNAFQFSKISLWPTQAELDAYNKNKESKK